MRFKRFLAIFIIFVLLCPASAYADEPYNNYNYDFWGSPIPAPAAYVPARIVDGRSLGINEFKKPSDLFTGRITSSMSQIREQPDSGHKRNWELTG